MAVLMPDACRPKLLCISFLSDGSFSFPGYVEVREKFRRASRNHKRYGPILCSLLHYSISTCFVPNLHDESLRHNDNACQRYKLIS
ncbi:hypothetical protein PAHAL_3G255700 [Panicum hallii]|uniref:Uncharacterized protein n=1 Tax=Panicum hallii TaxID=206008 RepID=A0A2T8KJG5_9POAL|nr:hypothetical protein PAHAL_3G255700 [Panicum hallii]